MKDSQELKIEFEKRYSYFLAGSSGEEYSSYIIESWDQHQKQGLDESDIWKLIEVEMEKKFNVMSDNKLEEFRHYTNLKKNFFKLTSLSTLTRNYYIVPLLFTYLCTEYFNLFYYLIACFLIVILILIRKWSQNQLEESDFHEVVLYEQEKNNLLNEQEKRKMEKKANKSYVVMGGLLTLGLVPVVLMVPQSNKYLQVFGLLWFYTDLNIVYVLFRYNKLFNKY